MRRCSLTSQTAANCTSFCSRKQPRSYVPRFPMPIPPTMTRSLGATVPSRPSAELGMIVGAAIAAPSLRYERSRLGLPHPDGAVGTPRADLLAARRESNRPDLASSVPRVQQLAAGGVPNSNRAVPAGRREPLATWIEGETENRPG